MSHDDRLERIAREVIDLGFQIHRELGPGLLESAYEALLAAALTQSGHEVLCQVPVTMRFKGVVVENAFKMDLLVDQCLVVEIKSVERLAAVHGKQLLTYPRLSDLRLGLLMNFGQATFKDAFRRVANDYFGPFGQAKHLRVFV
jgi:iron complex transport system substrate-binding protein